MPGGIARLLGEVARHAGPDLRVSTGRYPGAEAWDAMSGASVERVPVESRRLRTFPGLVRWALHSARLADRHQPAFLWAGNVKPAGHVAHWLGWRRRVPYGLLVYGLDLALLGEQARRSRGRRGRVIRRLLAGAAGTVAISRFTRDRYVELTEMLGLPGLPVRVVLPGVDAERFHPSAGKQAGGRPWLLTVARLVPHKGLDAGLALVAALRKEGIDVGYRVVGEGPARPALEAEAQARGIGDRVEFLGAVPDQDLPALYAGAALYVGLSRPLGPEVEGFGLSLLEAQASGVPVLAGAGGGTADAVADGEAGYLVPADQPGEVLAAARTLLTDPARRAAFGEAARARMLRDFRWSRVVAELNAAAEAFSALAGRAGR